MTRPPPDTNRPAPRFPSPTRFRPRPGGAARSLDSRAILPLAAWRDMLRALDKETPPEFCDWFAVERIDGRDIDVGLYRHWIDPSRPFAASLGQSAHGM